MSLKKEITKGYKILRRKGYIAKHRWCCCNNCGWHDIYKEYGDVDKVVFYNDQDYEHLCEHDEVYISWGGNGQEICDAFEKCDLKVEWNGREDTRILLKYNHK